MTDTPIGTSPGSEPAPIREEAHATTGMHASSTEANAPAYAHWHEGGLEHRALWHPESGRQPPKRIVVIDDTCTADTAFRLASQGSSMLWRGDFHNARQLLNAVARRIDQHRSKHQARQRKDEAAPLSPQEAFNQHRLAQSQRANLLNAILIELDGGFGIDLHRAPDVRQACQAALGHIGEPLLLPLRALQGMVGSFEWRNKGVAVPALPERIHVHYGVFSPLRGEYIDLVAQAPLPPADVAVDIGTGSGVLAAVLAARGIGKVIATDMDERALACARENIARQGLESRIDIVRADLFPQGRYGLIVCNPPWLPARPTSSLEHAIYDPGSTMLKGYLNRLAAHLNEHGEGWLIMSDLAEHLGLRPAGFLEETIRNAGLRVLGRLAAKPRHAKAFDASDPLHEARSAEITSLWRLGIL